MKKAKCMATSTQITLLFSYEERWAFFLSLFSLPFFCFWRLHSTHGIVTKLKTSCVTFLMLHQSRKCVWPANKWASVCQNASCQKQRTLGDSTCSSPVRVQYVMTQYQFHLSCREEKPIMKSLSLQVCFGIVHSSCQCQNRLNRLHTTGAVWIAKPQKHHMPES